MTFLDHKLIVEAEKARRYAVFCRKQLIHRCVALEIQWRQFFPHHDFADLRLIRSDVMSDWDEAAWRKAARDYYNERKGRMHVV